MVRAPVVLLALLLVVPMAAPAATAQMDQEDPFPDHDEVVQRLRELSDHPWVRLHEVGASVSGRTIYAAEVTDRTSEVPMEERTVTFVVTQQHGDEPAGTPAALDLIEEVTEGSLGHAVSNQVLVVVPMANPDGAQAGQRANAHGTDINRDHVALEEPEARAIHAVLNRWDVDVALDHHEYGGIGFGNPVPVRVYDYDLTTLFPVHGNVHVPARQAAKALMYQGIWPAARDAGYSVNEYGEVTAAGRPVDEVAGGPDPGILRNHLGLHHVAGLLIESRIDNHPNPFHDAARRIDSHRVVLEATVSYVHDHAEMFAGAREASFAEAVRHPPDRYVEGEATGSLAEAYRIPDADVSDVEETLARHALPGTVDGDDGRLVPVHHTHPGHAGALVHPASSRRLADGTAASLPAGDPAAAAGTGGETVPAPGAVPVAAAVLAGLLWVRRRWRGGTVQGKL